MHRAIEMRDGLAEVIFSDTALAETQAIESAIKALISSTPHNVETFCDELRKDLSAGRLSSDILERLSVWCWTNQPPKGVSDAARAVARLVLGVVPPRLRERGTKRVEDYHIKIAELKQVVH